MISIHFVCYFDNGSYTIIDICEISVHFSIESDNISHEVVQQILDASRDVHGSAMKMLGKSAEILFEFELSAGSSGS